MEIKAFGFFVYFVIGCIHLRGDAANGRLEQQFEKCCSLGTSWASEGLRCEKFAGPVAGVPMVEQAMCLETVDICCIRENHQKNCEKGMKKARKGLICSQSTDAGGSRGGQSDGYEQDCCEGCKLGILSGSLGQNCAFKAFRFGKPWDSAFLECCEKATTSSPTTNDDQSTTSGSTVKTTVTTPSTTSTDSTDSGEISVTQESDSSSTSAGNASTPRSDDLCQMFKGLLCSHICVPTKGSYTCACPSGYVLLEDEKTCRTDGSIAESSSSSAMSTQSPTTLAMPGVTPTLASMHCPLGYRYNPSTNLCNDIDECREKTDICGHEVCYNQPGGYSCAQAPTPITKEPIRQQTLATSGPMECSSGQRYVRHRGCVDINECEEIQDVCTSNEECVNNVGSYVCNCRTGFRRDNLTQACVDINECQLPNDCLSTQRCDNTLGSYNCVRFLPCGTGYTLNAATEICEDDDECLLGTHDCGEGYHCRNTLGSYRCNKNPRGSQQTPSPRITTPRPPSTLVTTTTTMMTSVIDSRNQPERTCPRGFFQGGRGECVDIDECTQGPSNPCSSSPLQQCINTIGSYQCLSSVICGAGFTLDPKTNAHCVDIDECSDGTHKCNARQTCENRPGGYVCACPPGHALTSNRNCVDIDECSIYARNICGATGQCENTVGSFRCICNSGFERIEGGNGCEDINECQRHPGICQHDCINVWGSYSCVCKPGYSLNNDNRSCSDIDECQMFKDNNLCVGFCDNTPGSYACRCPDGYRLGEDGRTCQDIDECAAGVVCRDPSEMCQNTRGGYRCNRIQCPSGYHRDQERKNRCVRTSRYCPSGDISCYQLPSHYSFNFITFVSLLPIPRSRQLELFTMRGTHLPGSIVRFSMALINAQAPPGVTRATESCFALRKPSPSQAVLVLTKSLPGPQEIELDLSMEIYHDTAFAGSAVAKLFIYVTQYEF